MSSYLSAATPAVKHTVRSRAVPGHANKQAAVVPEIRRPPVLRIRHQRGNVLLQRLVIEALEGRGIVELAAQRVGDGRVLAQDAELEGVGPPVAVAGAAAVDVHQAMSGTLALSHVGRFLVGRCLKMCGKIRRI